MQLEAAILGRVCGIGGTAGELPDPELLERMASTMARRGPDGQRTWHDDVVGFAFRRLAIIDLHERSSQPQHLGALHLVFNGEIYNYRELRGELRGLGHEFKTEGDAEVLLHAWSQWGESALQRLNGMFALAVWDDRRRSLTLASDPFGEKPLYYAVVGGRLVFASEIKDVLKDSRVPSAADDEAVARFLALSYMPRLGMSFFGGVRRLPAAHVLRWREGAIETQRYWRPGRVEVGTGYQDAVATLRDLLLDSIRLRLRSDVPVGTSLSGGIDSSLVVMLSAELEGDHSRHAFTAAFPGFERDESTYAREVAEAAHVVHHHLVEPRSDEVLEDAIALVRDHEEPVGSLSIYAQWRVMAEAAAAGVTVLLDGQGGDELFGGYPISTGFALRSLGPRTALKELLAEPSTAGVLGRSLGMDYLPSPARRLYRRRVVTPYASRSVTAAAATEDGPSREPWVDRAAPLARELMTESFFTSLPELLRYADRSSMAHGREVRLPLLDRRIAEFAFSLPASHLYANGRSKRILRDAGRGLVPDVVLSRRDKVGFEPPQRHWLAEPGLRDLVADTLLDPVARRRGLYDTSAVEADLRGGQWRDPRGIWRALNVELWLTTLVSARPAMLQPV